MWTLALPMPKAALARHRDALDLGQAAFARSKVLRQELAALDAQARALAARTPRTPTLVGVAAQSAQAPAWAPHVAAGLGPRPSARGSSR
jgi:hypothetical protein